jgi:tRNA(adenine34) deaminase
MSSVDVYGADMLAVLKRRIEGQDMGGSVVDRAMMARCVRLSRSSGGQGEYPFGSVVAHGETIVGEGVNHVFRDGDESRHAEIVAIANARQTIGSNALRECTVYSTVEPCPMCSFVIRTAGVRRVVFALHSPVMGGMSRWDILQSKSSTRALKALHGEAPEIVSGVLADEALQAWKDWRPLVARAMFMLGFFVRGEQKRPSDAREPAVFQNRFRAYERTWNRTR